MPRKSCNLNLAFGSRNMAMQRKLRFRSRFEIIRVFQKSFTSCGSSKCKADANAPSSNREILLCKCNATFINGCTINLLWTSDILGAMAQLLLAL